jgi:hypothetical protein
MKQIVLFFFISTALGFVFVCNKNKPTPPTIPEDPSYYYPRQEKYSWRYIHLAPGCEKDAIADSFYFTILRANTRHGDVGYDRFRNADTNAITFIFKIADTLFAEPVGQGVPLYKILVGPVKAGTYWTDSYFNYLIQGFEDVTLTINGETYKRCAKIMKRYLNPTKTNKIYEWWVPQYGEVKWIEVDAADTCREATELRYFSPTGVFP